MRTRNARDPRWLSGGRQGGWRTGPVQQGLREQRRQIDDRREHLRKTGFRPRARRVRAPQALWPGSVELAVDALPLTAGPNQTVSRRNQNRRWIILYGMQLIRPTNPPPP